MGSRRLHVATVTLAVAVVATAGEARSAEPPTLLCTPPPGSELLPPTARRGLIDHLLQYPAVHLATRAQRGRARHVLAELLAAASRQGWRSPSMTAQMTYYETPKGARVFAAGAFYFTRLAHVDPVTSRVLENLWAQLSSS